MKHARLLPHFRSFQDTHPRFEKFPSSSPACRLDDFGSVWIAVFRARAQITSVECFVRVMFCKSHAVLTARQIALTYFQHNLAVVLTFLHEHVRGPRVLDGERLPNYRMELPCRNPLGETLPRWFHHRAIL